MATPAGILFDFDYTLADSSDAVVDCVRVAFEKMKLPAVDHEAVRRTIGLPLPETFQILSGQSEEEQVLEFRAHFRERSNQIMVDWTRFLPGVPETIAKLSERGLKLGIVSTKYRFRIRQTLERDGLLDPFDVIVGGDDVEDLKPHPSGLLLAAAGLSQPVDALVYVGDSVTDADAAQRAAMPFVGVLTGWATQDDFTVYKARAILDTLDALPDRIRSGL